MCITIGFLSLRFYFRPDTLGRGKTAAEFVRTGEDEAEISIELHKGGTAASGRNGVWTVKRRWSRQLHCMVN